jgi:hypothetical protein
MAPIVIVIRYYQHLFLSTDFFSIFILNYNIDQCQKIKDHGVVINQNLNRSPLDSLILLN